jgi:hypothetical protein
LSQFLTLGEISPRQVWHVARQAMMQGAADAEAFIKQLVWREFGYHLMYHTPHITTGNWSEKWDHFPWQEDEDHPHVLGVETGAHGHPIDRRGHARNLCDGLYAQSRTDECWILFDKASVDALAHWAKMV